MDDKSVTAEGADTICYFNDVEPHPSRPRKAIEPGQLLINGKWVDAEAGETMKIMDPTTEASIIRVQKGGAFDAAEAIEAACAAVEDGL